MEKTTINTFLMHSATQDGEFKKLVDITSYPDIFTAPEKLDISDMSSKQKKYTPGMVDLPDYEFGFIYDKAAYEKVKALEGQTGYYQLRFGKNEYTLTYAGNRLRAVYPRGERFFKLENIRKVEFFSVDEKVRCRFYYGETGEYTFSV